jgi:phage shock protein PspC (stress-responsive transcriptional regulator)
MKKIVWAFRRLTEEGAFGVCTWLGKKMGIYNGNIRLAFIYLSFITFGSPLIIYLMMAFILKHKYFFKPGAKRRSSVWEI